MGKGGSRAVLRLDPPCLGHRLQPRHYHPSFSLTHTIVYHVTVSTEITMAGIPLQSTEQDDVPLLRAGRPGWTVTASANGNQPISVGARSVGHRRSGPRSRAGCVTCKQRRVRCDETHPACGHCIRLQLNCYYRPHAKRPQASAPNSRNGRVPNASTRPIDPQGVHATLQNVANGILSPFLHSHPLNAGDGVGSIDLSNVELWSNGRGFHYTDLAEELSTSWAGEFSFLFPEGSTIPSSTLAAENGQIDVPSHVFDESTVAVPDSVINKDIETRTVPQLMEVPGMSGSQASLPQDGQPAGLSASPQQYDQTLFREDSPSEPTHRSAQLIRRFLRIAQPPAAILIGGSKRWRRLQEYLCKTSEQSRAVENALLCLVGLLTIDEACKELVGWREQCMELIHEHHQHACDDIRTELAKHLEIQPTTTEPLLAAIFLLAWFEVIYDQDDRHSLFPRDLADSIILSKSTWSRSSQELLSWMNTLDCKAAHLGGEHLLSQQSIEIVSHYQTQIASSSDLDAGVSSSRPLPDALDGTPSNSTPGSASDFDLPRTQPRGMNSLAAQEGQVKRALLNAILQPALQWYLTSQSYCRRISAHDRYHRRRLTSEDEYEIITACKQLESELSELWNFRPTVISLTAEQLREVVSADLATRLEEVFSVYLASFWILFVYLHRVSWWNLPLNLPHSNLVRRALSEVWRTMQRAYGEVIEGTTKKVVHPSLLWPLFLFGSECLDPRQREWAIQQLEDLGEVKPVLENEESDTDILSPFRLCSGATRNAKRAAVLLTKLTEEQDRKNFRVDVRDLSMKLFGCHFSIV